MAIRGPLQRTAASAVVGFGAGATLGLVGWGGAQIIIPSLTSPAVLGLSQLAATGVSLSSLSCAVVVGAARFTSADLADVSMAAAIALPSMLGARIGSKLSARLNGEVHALIFNGLSVLLLPTNFLVQRFRQQQLESRRTAEEAADAKICDSSSSPQSMTSANLLQHGCWGLSSGVLAAVMGVGGLPITMSYLTLASDLPHHLIQGTAMLSVAPAVVTSAASHAISGATPLGTAAAVAAGAMVGSVAGSSVALALSDEQLRGLYMASLLLLGGRSFVGATRNVSRILAARRSGGGGG
jgi:uncharacterized membrane protein YfcA